MRGNEPLEYKIQRIHGMSREQCIEELVEFREVPLDFTEPFLRRQELTWLRHTLLAANLAVQRRGHSKAG